MTELPEGFTVHVANMGVKDDTDDLMVLVCDRPATAAGMFTKSRFAGPSVPLSQEHLADGSARAVVIISKNANVANGPQGEADAREVVDLVAAGVGCSPDEVAIASTGVIGVKYPMEPIRSYLSGLSTPFESNSADAAAIAIMTTDTHPKVAAAELHGVQVVGIAKGVGMIEPDMATMLAVITTNAKVDHETLDWVFRGVVDRTFNALSVDTDTSTSDSVYMLASGAGPEIDPIDLEALIGSVALDLTRQLAADGEGAETLIEVRVAGARDDEQAKRVAKAIVNSPLVKTAVHGADPNWGRVAMAIGKCNDADIDQERVVIRFGDAEVYPTPASPEGLAALEEYLRGDEVLIDVDLAIAGGAFTVYGCDLTDGYVRINADYTT